MGEIYNLSFSHLKRIFSCCDFCAKQIFSCIISPKHTATVFSKIVIHSVIRPFRSQPMFVKSSAMVCGIFNTLNGGRICVGPSLQAHLNKSRYETNASDTVAEGVVVSIRSSSNVWDGVGFINGTSVCVCSHKKWNQKNGNKWLKCLPVSSEEA